MVQVEEGEKASKLLVAAQEANTRMESQLSKARQQTQNFKVIHGMMIGTPRADSGRGCSQRDKPRKGRQDVRAPECAT